MNHNQKHTQALTRFRRGQKEEAIRLFAEALSEKESAECWNDWATAQLACGVIEEAETGYRRALELDPDNQDAWVNLGVLAYVDNRFGEALSLLRRALLHATVETQDSIHQLIRQCQEHVRPEEEAESLERYLRRFAGQEEAAQRYFETRVSRYVAVTQLLPRALPGQRLLEVGPLFHHLPPALKQIKGYEVVCAGFWDGPSQIDYRLADKSRSEEFVFPAYNFDPESAPWPFADSSFDVVLSGELLERLARDPMLVLQEINRVLKPEGHLLLTTPNLASAKSVACALRGHSPYISGGYVVNGRVNDRHNREYTAGELERILQLAGFGQIRLHTRNTGSGDPGAVLRHLLGLGMPVSRRGDEIIALAQKQSAVQERFPVELYRQSDRPAGSTEHAPPSPGLLPAPERILIVHDELPQFDRRGPDRQLLQALRTLRELNHQVTYVARSKASGNRYEEPLREIGVKLFAGDADKLRAVGVAAPASDWNFETVVRAGGFDIAILVHGFWSGLSITEQYVDEIRKYSPATKILVLSTQDGARELRLAEVSGLATDAARAANFQQRELESYRRADLVLALSDDDCQALRKLDSGLNIELWPMAVVVEPRASGYQERQDLIFLANFDNRANTQALQWFRGEIWPKVRRALPGVKLHVAGNGCPGGVAAEGIVSLGHIADVGQVLSRYRIFVSPVRFAAGIESENVMALAHGLPLITTVAGAKGLELKDGVQALIADSASQFAAAVTRSYSDAKLWRVLAENGRTYIESRFSPSQARQQVEKILQSVRSIHPARIPAHRWSIRIVEEIQPRILSDETLTPFQSVELRAISYAEYAERLLTEGKAAEAGAQLQHIFSFFRDPLPQHPFFARVLVLLERCHLELGEAERAGDCGREALLFMPEFNLELASGASLQRGKPGAVKMKTATSWAVQ